MRDPEVLRCFNKEEKYSETIVMTAVLRRLAKAIEK